ncbi:RNA binding protein [Malassezia pachydermatis]
MADPFPSLGESTVPSVSAAAKSAKAPARPDVTSEDAFPSLGAASSAASRPGASAWVSSVPVIQRVTHTASVSLRLSEEQMMKLSTLLQRVQDKCRGVKIEASTTRKTGVTMFIIKGPSESAVQQAKKELSVQLARKVQLSMLIPAALRPFVVGAGGKNIKAITEQTGVRIHIPPRSKDLPMEENEDPLLGEQTEVTIEGDEVNALEAQEMIHAIVAERTSKITQRVASIEPIYYPFIFGPRGKRAAELAEQQGRGEVQVHIPPPMRDGPIVVSGERNSVTDVVQAIQDEVDQMRRLFRTLSINIPKRQHAFLVGDSAADILAATQCSIELPPVHDPSENVTIRGPQAQLPQALTAAIERANAVSVQPLDLRALYPDADEGHARRVVQWLAGRLPREDGVQVFLPRASALDQGLASVDVVGEDAASVMRMHQQLEALARPIGPHAVRVAEVDPLAHGFVVGKKGQGLRNYENKGIDVLVPPESSGRSDVLLVFRGVDKEPRPDEVAMAAALDAAVAELAMTAAQAADLRTEHIQIPAKFHPDRNLLNAILGEDRLHVSLGARHPSKHVTEPLTDDSVVVRGASEAVARAIARLQQLAAEAEQDQIVNGHVDQIEVPGQYVPHLIGRGGAGVAKLRDELGVKVDFGDLDEEARRKNVPIVITGRKACVDEAKARLQAQAQRLADEVTVRINVPNDMHGALIGQGGKYVSRLQDKYDVRINFPHAGGDDSLKPDEVSIRGGKKGVAEAKAELLELLAYEQERSNSESMSVSARAIPRILGRGGAMINQLRLTTGAQIDVESEPSRGSREGTASLRLRGAPAQIAEAKNAIQSIVDQVESEAEIFLTIPSKFHGQIIGQGGQNLRDLIQRAGGPSDAKAQAQMVRFPRGGGSDEVSVRASKELAAKVAELLQAHAQGLADRVVYGAVAPPTTHSQLIARGGRRHSPWLTEHGVQVIVPNWREFAELGTPANEEELKDADPSHVVKVHGPKDAVPKVLDEIKKVVESDAQRRSNKPRSRAAMHARVDEVPDEDA